MNAGSLSGVFTTQTTQGTSPSPGVLGTLHESFKPWLGYNVNFDYTRFSENYSYGSAFVPAKGAPFPPSSTFTQGSIGTNMYEVTIARGFRGARTRRSISSGNLAAAGFSFCPPKMRLKPGSKRAQR